ncbi:hypothetical protein [Vallitalea okinawensis]|uniref:hypothetical protein n=1 Tax=Vallitalea okinawensis TaxID=2078660 RepID=UPI000CFD7245|nr:hypothetical protein [Vallitalea okinawensis]
MLKRLIAFFLVISLLMFQIPSNATVVGEGGSIPGGGSVNLGGGLASLSPIYRVSIIREKLRDGKKINPNDTSNQKKEKLIYHFSNHFPNMDDYNDSSKNYSVYFAPPIAEYLTDKYILYKYNNSTRDIDPIVTDDTSKIFRNLGITKLEDDYENFYLNALSSLTPDDLKNKDVFEKAWKKISDTRTEADCIALWNTILADPNPQDAMRDYIKDDFADPTESPENQYQARLAYLDLMITLYRLGDKDIQDHYTTYINDYFFENETDTSPVLIAIDTAVGVSVPDRLPNKVLILPSVDYVQYATGVIPKYDFTLPSFNFKYDKEKDKDKSITKAMIKAAVQGSADTLPNDNSIMELFVGNARGNAFYWGFSGVTGDVLKIINNVADWHTSSVVGIMESLVFDASKGYYGFMIVGGNHQLPRLPEGTYKLEASVDGEVAGEKAFNIDGKSETLGKYISIELDLNQTEDNMKDWENYAKNKENIEMLINLTRDPIGENLSINAGTQHPMGTYRSVTYEELMNYLSGNIIYQDDVSSHFIEEGKNVQFTYTADIKVKFDEEVVFVGNPDSVTATFYRPIVPEPEYALYNSTPEYWSEFKQGSPGHEEFEAMAGTPTTKNLYFASGGSEFIVDILCEYIEDGTATRNYTSIFDSVDCEDKIPHQGPLHNSGMSSQSGSWSISPPKPTPRQITGYNGATHTESLSKESKKVIDQAEKRDSEGNITQSEKSHMEYRWVQNGLSACTGCGPCHEHIVGGYQDDWSQHATFDYMKIVNVNVWKLTHSKADGLYELLDTDEVTASIVQGEPNIFSNIASSDTSAAGRLRYSLETDQHDHVTWNEGDSDNSHSNSITSGAVNEQAKFTERRNMTTNVTAISDFLILQTSSGDQSVIYFDKASPSKKTTESLEVPKTSIKEMWDNNPNSAANWDAYEINIGSYNGNYKDVYNKYSTYNHSNVATILDTLPAGLNRPLRPSSAMRLMKTGIDVPDDKENGEYILGMSSVFYENILSHGGDSNIYSCSYNSHYGLDGQEFTTTYNDIVIHNPVSVEDAMVIPLPEDRDQRTQNTKSISAGLPDVIEYDKIFNCHFTGGREHNDDCYVTEIRHSGLNDHVHDASCLGPIYDCGLTEDPNGWKPCPQCGSTSGYHMHCTGGCQLTECNSCNYRTGGSGTSGINAMRGHTHTTSCYTVICGNTSGYTWRPCPNCGSTSGYHKHCSSGCQRTECNNCDYRPGGSGTSGINAQKIYHTHTNSCYKQGNVCNNLPYNIHTCGTGCVNTKVLKCVEPHHSDLHTDACYDLIPRSSNPTTIETPDLGSFSPGNFINLDYGFTVYYPNTGDFEGNNAHGIGSTTRIRGKGFHDNMDTTEWVKTKSITFDFNVIFEGNMYAAGEEIFLDIYENYYDFYCPLANKEAIDAKVTYKIIAINGRTMDNSYSTNRTRYSNLAAKHSAIKNTAIDVVGRIGTLVIEDTGDYRFSNFFKNPLLPEEWFIPNMVKRVDTTSQNSVVGSDTDVRGLSASSSTDYLNTYGALPHLEAANQFLPIPLTPQHNNLSFLQNQPLRPGYNVFADIQTIGNYYNQLQIIPYYYVLNLDNGSIQDVDIYMNVNDDYKLINQFGAAVPGWDPTSVYQYIYDLDWEGEKYRRNFSMEENQITQDVSEYMAYYDDNFEVKNLDVPMGSSYPFGTAQILQLDGRNRTFIGTSDTYGLEKNPGGYIPEIRYNQQAQRWHFTYGLPSSAVAVLKGKEPTQENIDAIRTNQHVLLMAADMKAVGDTFVLQYNYPNSTVTIANKNFNLSSIPYPVLNVYSAHKSSADDLEVRGTH